jgi:hypothetical protein
MFVMPVGVIIDVDASVACIDGQILVNQRMYTVPPISTARKNMMHISTILFVTMRRSIACEAPCEIARTTCSNTPAICDARVTDSDRCCPTTRARARNHQCHSHIISAYSIIGTCESLSVIIEVAENRRANLLGALRHGACAASESDHARTRAHGTRTYTRTHARTFLADPRRP